MVEREDGFDVLPMGKVNKAGVSQLRAHVFIPLHQLRDGSRFVAAKGKQIQEARPDAPQQSLNGCSIAPKQPQRFGNHRPTRE